MVNLFRRYQPDRAIAYKQGDPPPPHIAKKCKVIFEGGAAKMPNVVDKDGVYRTGRLVASQLKGFATDEHCWVWLKPEQLVRYDPERLKVALTRQADIVDHIRSMAGLRRPTPQRVDLVNEALHPRNDSGLLKVHDFLDDQVSVREIGYYFARGRAAMPNSLMAYNDWGCETNRARAERLLDLLTQLQRISPTSAPQVVGLQCHLFGGDDLSTLDWLCGRLRSLGFITYFTEIDIDEATEGEQTRLAKELMRIVRKHKVKQITLWQWRDKNHWRPGAAPFDEYGEPKEWARVLGYA